MRTPDHRALWRSYQFTRICELTEQLRRMRRKNTPHYRALESLLKGYQKHRRTVGVTVRSTGHGMAIDIDMPDIYF